MTVIEIQGETFQPQKIVVAVDSSLNSEKALEWAMNNTIQGKVPTLFQLVHVACVPFSFVSTFGLSSEAGREEAKSEVIY